MQSPIENFESLAVGIGALMTGIAALLASWAHARSKRSKSSEPSEPDEQS